MRRLPGQTAARLDQLLCVARARRLVAARRDHEVGREAVDAPLALRDAAGLVLRRQTDKRAAGERGLLAQLGACARLERRVAPRVERARGQVVQEGVGALAVLAEQRDARRGASATLLSGVEGEDGREVESRAGVADDVVLDIAPLRSAAALSARRSLPPLFRTAAAPRVSWRVPVPRDRTLAATSPHSHQA